MPLTTLASWATLGIVIGLGGAVWYIVRGINERAGR